MANTEIFLRNIFGTTRPNIRPLVLALNITNDLLFEQHKFCTKKTVYITDIEFQISYFYISTFRVVDFLIYKIEQYLLYYITQKPSGVQIGRLFCMDRREGGGEIITEIHPVKLRNFHEKEVGE